MHETIKRYYLKGEVQYDKFTQARETLERSIEDQMRDEGFVPVLDMDPQLTQSMNARGNFEIAMSVYAAYVGKDSWKVAGIMGGKPIMKHIPKSKSKQSSTASA